VIHIGDNRVRPFAEFKNIAAFIKNIPVIFLAEKDDENDETAAFAVGAADYTLRRHGSARALINRINLRINSFSEPGVIPEKILSGKTILVAEDVELNRDIIFMLLSGIKDLALVFAVNGKEAVEKFAEKPELYSLIFMDIHMPEMDGLEAARTIRNLNCTNAREIPIIALTASINEEEIACYLKAGMNDFSQKPISYDKLINIAVKYC